MVIELRAQTSSNIVKHRQKKAEIYYYTIV